QPLAPSSPRMQSPEMLFGDGFMLNTLDMQNACTGDFTMVPPPSIDLMYNINLKGNIYPILAGIGFISEIEFP
ncbi:MAG: hypothetical protein ACNA8H_05875, partial [Anaerolineales bacterium]